MNTIQKPLPTFENQNVNDVMRHTLDSTGRRRLMFRFWLDDNKPSESELGASLEVMKSKRKYSQTIRDALRLIFALLLGDTSVLMELFPAIVFSIQQAGRADLEAQNAALQATIEQQEARIAALEADSIEVKQFSGLVSEMQAMKAMLQTMQRTPESVTVDATQKPQNGANSSAMQPIGVSAGNGGIKPITGLKPLTPPTYDDSDDDIILDVKTATRKPGEQSAAQNFINAMFALQGG